MTCPRCGLLFTNRRVGLTPYKSLIRGIVYSTPFQMKVKESTSPAKSDGVKTAQISSSNTLLGRKRCESLDCGFLEEVVNTMIVTKKLSRARRSRGIGAVVALPFLDAMVPAFAATANSAANPASRFSRSLYFPHGAHRPEWIPKSDAPHFELPRTLQPLEPMHEHINVITNIDLSGAAPGRSLL